MLDHKAYVPMFCENVGEIVTLSCDVLKIDGKYGSAEASAAKNAAATV